MSINDVKTIFHSGCFPENQKKLEEIAFDGSVIMEANINDGGVKEYLSCRLDPNKGRIFPYFVRDTGKGLNSICDYFLFVEQVDTLYIFLVELKTGSASSAIQLEASHCFMNFIVATANRLGIDVSKIEIIKVRFHPSQKRTTATCKPSVNDKVITYPWGIFRIKAVLDLYLSNVSK